MLNIQRIRAISLDLDDTLWPIAPTIRRARETLQQWLLQHAPRTAHLLCAPEVMLRIRKKVVADASRTRPEMAHDLSALQLESVRLALLEAGEDGALAPQAFYVYLAQRQRVELFDDALFALEFLSQRYPIIGLSNGNADVQRIGIGRYFRASLSAGELGMSKPDPRVFQKAAARASVDVTAVLHIGDDAELDALGGMRAGMQSIWLNRAGLDWPHQEAPHATVRDLRQLCALWSA